MAGSTEAKRQAPLKVDPEIDELISLGAHFLGLTKKDLVAEAVKDYLAARRQEIHSSIRSVYKSTRTKRRLIRGCVARSELVTQRQADIVYCFCCCVVAATWI